MIYTVTFNPSLDYVITTEDFALGKTNRAKNEQIFPGGKGINVSIVLKNLGVESTAIGFTAGFTGEEIQRRLKEMGLRTDFLPVREGMSRINVKLKSIEGTELNGIGPRISREETRMLFERLDRLQKGDFLVLAGSVPAGLPDTIYGEICGRMAPKGVELVVDAAGELLKQVLPYRPFLIKPNCQELGELFGVEIQGKAQAASRAGRLVEMGAKNVLVSMAGQGAVFAAENGTVCELDAPKGTLVNGVGAGDSMVAGFLKGWMETRDYDTAFKMGVAAGSACAFSEFLADAEKTEKLFREIT